MTKTLPLAALLALTTACIGGSSYSPSDDTGYDYGDNPGAEASPVGAWYIAGTLTDGTELEVGWMLCPDGRMKGFERFDNYEFLNKGTWSGDDDLTITYTSRDTSIGDTWGPDTADMSYDSVNDELCCYAGANMWRLEGEVRAGDCDVDW